VAAIDTRLVLINPFYESYISEVNCSDPTFDEDIKIKLDIRLID